MGKPAAGVDFLKALYRRQGDLFLLDQAAALEERAGQIDAAIATLEQIRSLAPSDTARDVRLASLLFLRSRFDRAYALLLPLRGSTGTDAEYWKMLADLAWQLQEDNVASDAYGQLQQRGDDVPIGAQRPEHGGAHGCVARFLCFGPSRLRHLGVGGLHLCTRSLDGIRARCIAGHSFASSPPKSRASKARASSQLRIGTDGITAGSARRRRQKIHAWKSLPKL